MEQEICKSRELRSASRLDVIDRIRQRWETLPVTTSDDLDRWRTVERWGGDLGRQDAAQISP